MVELVARIARLLDRGGRARAGRPSPRRRPACEPLEGREMLTGLGTDYTLMGGQWNKNQPITFSFPPDGVSWDGGTNDLNARLDAEFGGSSWQGLVAKALQTWAAVTNLDFVEVGDGPYAFNVPGASEGDPRFGDIRIGGYDYGNMNTVARTYGPPPNGQTAAGDVELNTEFDFAPGANYDLETVLLHELGHALGLGESPQPSSIMYTYYSGVRQSLSPDDVEGIQAIYGPRLADPYQSSGRATSASNALDLTSYLNSAHQTELGGVGLDKIGDVEYFSVVAPAINGATFRVGAKASGISLLSPKLTVIDPSTGATLATAGDASEYGNYVSVAIPNAQAGHRYLIAVTGATGDAFSVGSYAVQVGFFGGTPITPAPAPAPAPTPTPTPTPAPAPAPTPTPVTTPVQKSPAVLPDRYEPNNTFATAAELGPMGQTVVNNLTITSASDVRVFAFEVAEAGTVLVASANTTILVGDFLSRPVVSGTGLIGFAAPVAGARYYLVFLSPTGGPVASFGFAIATIPNPTAGALSTASVPIPTTTEIPTTTNPTSRARSKGKKS